MSGFDSCVNVWSLVPMYTIEVGIFVFTGLLTWAFWDEFKQAIAAKLRRGREPPIRAPPVGR